MYLDEFFPNEGFREYRVVVIVSRDRNKEEFEFVVNKRKPYSKSDLERTKNEIFTKILKIAKKNFKN
ncbi:MAG: hypothetical protein QT11_C0001G0139 [archaeon GW2011_AR20]|nr:MAG: hypothetical protein QT11_C0001G0139 [archaeon GW2011_AR20]MBS3160689.1 hypothetical protein [Candidatus Woesearchaeota archaeon]